MYKVVDNVWGSGVEKCGGAKIKGILGEKLGLYTFFTRRFTQDLHKVFRNFTSVLAEVLHGFHIAYYYYY